MMKKQQLRLKSLLVAAAMLSAVGAAHVATPTVHMADQGPKLELETLFPKSFAGWRLDEGMPVVLPSPDVQAVLNKIYNQVLSRTYVNAQGDRVMLSVAYGGDQSDGTRAHRPEVCYPAQGFQIQSSSTGRYSIAGQELPVRNLVAKLGGRIEPISYWVVVGEELALSGTQQKLAQLRYGVRGLIPDGMLMRVSTIGSDAPAAYRVHQAFLADLFAATQSVNRARVFGQAGRGGA
jgi:EpsI family protein